MFSKSMLSSIALLAAACAVSATDSNSVKNPIYIISNAEVPSLGRPGLSIIGEQRATQCLPEVRAPPTSIHCVFETEKLTCLLVL